MAFFNLIRKNIYWLLDGIKGGDVRRHFLNIKDILKRKDNDNEVLLSLLHHATKTVKYYKGRELLNNIVDFPVVNKLIIKSDIQSFISNAYHRDSLLTQTTSGSTGTPFTVYQDVNKKNRNTADTIVFASKAGFNLGQKLYYLKIWSSANRKNFLTKYMQNIDTIDVLNMDEKKISALLEKFQRENNSFGVIGYASALETLCNYCETNAVQINKTKLSSMISISETLTLDVKQKLTNLFGIMVVARYSNVENGIFAQQRLDGSDEFELNHASYFFEILDINEDVNLPDGEMGRIVITDLYNYGMPMIRYDTGDIGTIIKSPITGFRVLINLEGRKLDVLYNTQSQLVSSLLVYKNMWKYKEIDQYQLIQKGLKSYTLKISSIEGFKRNKEIIEEYKLYLGHDADINIEFVEEIPLLASGKRRKVLNEYYK